MKTTILTIVAASVISAGTSVQAQQYANRVYVESGYSNSGGNYGSYHHASTAAEGYLRGAAAAIHAQGEYNRMTAQAMLAAEQARQLRIQNHELAVRTRYAIQQANQQARANARRPRITNEEAEQMAAKARPSQLSPRAFNAQTGHISWPAALAGKEFGQARQQMESLFARRVSSGRLGDDDVVRANEVAKTILTKLKGQVRKIRPMEYTAALRFSQQLAYEARQPVDSVTNGLAMVQPTR